MSGIDTATVSSLFSSVSIILAFFGGMIMLFAPCCITLMLPAYLGTVFKSKSRILLMTLVFAAGIATIMLPITLGARFIASFFNSYHFLVFAAGSLLMIGIGIMSLTGKTIPLPFASRLQSPRLTNAASAYALGVVSGISSSCCAPVLLGALTLAALSPGVMQAAGVGLAYTFGIVFPLLILSLFVQKGLWKQTLKLQQKFLQFGRLRVSLANFLSFLVFTITGLVFLFLAATNQIQMSESVLQLTIKLKNWLDMLTRPIRAVPYAEYIFGGLLIFLLLYLIYLGLRQKEEHEEDNN